MRNSKDIQVVLAQFERAAFQHSLATEVGNYKVANKNYCLIEESVAALRNSGRLQLLSRFLSHDSIAVQVWAATYLLSVDEVAATATLEKIVKEEGFLSLEAETVLLEWRNGNLKP